MGGACWFEYVKRIDHAILSSNCTITVALWDGGKKTLNTNYIVEAEDYDIAMAAYNSRNPNFETGKYLVARLIPDGGKISLSNEFMRD